MIEKGGVAEVIWYETLAVDISPASNSYIAKSRPETHVRARACWYHGSFTTSTQPPILYLSSHAGWIEKPYFWFITIVEFD